MHQIFGFYAVAIWGRGFECGDANLEFEDQLCILLHEHFKSSPSIQFTKFTNACMKQLKSDKISPRSKVIFNDETIYCFN